MRITNLNILTVQSHVPVYRAAAGPPCCSRALITWYGYVADDAIDCAMPPMMSVGTMSISVLQCVLYALFSDSYATNCTARASQANRRVLREQALGRLP